MSFLTSAYLGALALAAIPILIHLIRRRKIRIIQWAAWDFLLQAKRKNRRRLRLEQLLLLLLRMALVCLVVLALTRPVIKVTGMSLLSTDSRVHALIVLDNSYSMGYSRQGQSDFARAVKIADDLVGKVLKPGDSVSLVLASSHPEAIIKEPSFNLTKARESLRRARLGDYGTDYAATAAFCARLLKNVQTPTREIYWLTDNQKSGFSDSAREETKSIWKTLSETGRLTWINVEENGRQNLSVEAPIFSRELITPRSPVRIESTIHNFSASSRHQLILNLTVDGKPAGTTSVKVEAGGKARAQFLHLFDKPGYHSGTIQVAQSDSLSRDDMCYFAVRVREKLKVLVIDSHPASDPAKDEAYYLATALSPSGASGEGKTAIEPSVHTGASLSGVNLHEFDAVVITGAEDLARADRRTLDEYVTTGGGLLLFPSVSADPAKMNSAFGLSGSSNSALVPATFGPRRLLQDEAAVSLNAASISSSALSAFRDSSEVDFSSGKYSAIFELTPFANDESVKVMCRFTGGQPAFIEKKFGQGKVIVSASTAGTSGNTLPLRPAYVPLVHQLVSYIASGPASRQNLTVGDSLVARFEVKESGKPIRFSTPDGGASIRASALTAQGVIFSQPAVQRAGLYRVSTSDAATQQLFAANVPGSEGDLKSLSDNELRAAIGNIPAQVAGAGDHIETLVRRSRRGSEVWRGLILCALPLLFLEALLAQRFGRRG